MFLGWIFKTCRFAYWGESQVALGILPKCLHFSLLLLQFQPIFVSFVAISPLLCHCFKAMLLAGFTLIVLCQQILRHSRVSADIREFKIRRLRTTATDIPATAHDQNHVTVHFSRVALQLRWVVELFRVVGTTENILLVFCRLSNSRISSFLKKFSIHLL